MNDTDSGLGIGGHGSDDYNINTPEPVIPQPPAQPRRGFGAQGTRYDERCDSCWRTGEVCNNCGNCRKHCEC
jgi:hypothetical protein